MAGLLDIFNTDPNYNYYGTLASGDTGWNTNTQAFASGGITNYKETSGQGLFGNLMGATGANQTLGTIGGLGNIASGLYNMYAGNKMLDMYEDQLDISKDKWKQNKQELQHLRGTRDRIGQSYMA